MNDINKNEETSLTTEIDKDINKSISTENDIPEKPRSSKSDVMDFILGCVSLSIINLMVIIANTMLSARYENNFWISLIWVPVILIINLIAIKFSKSQQMV